jgi:hypothetical protein
MGRKEGGLGGISGVWGLLLLLSGRPLLGCLPTALGFSCFALGLLASLLDCLPAALAFPCILIGLLASPLCGAALTFFAAAKKVSKESGLPTASQ